MNAGWNWDNVSDPVWSRPAEDVYYLLHRWKDKGLLSFLDLGCGIGRHALLFAQQGFSVTAYDVSESGLRILSRSARDLNLPITTILGDVTRLPFADRSFDSILAYHSIYHVDSQGMRAALSELRRVLRPDGEAYVTMNSKTSASFTRSASSASSASPASPESATTDAHVRIKREEDGTALPHYYCDLQDIRSLFAEFPMLRVRQIEDIYRGGSGWHYFVHLGREG